ncbi:hypothetical protein L596_030109 [Steinernema carpocapsae]|uniref:Uncharacterized protein n=1 Tax=Steinernema carpocapsae TaxID=34508 RepID=A0A4U5LRS3_STECR|nr:hypothetical protein L596_030109 [Steinernema carpocapsae]
MENASTIWESGKRELAKQLSPQTWIFEGLGEGDQSTLKTCFFLPLPLVIMTFFIFRMFSGKNPSAVDARRLHDCLTRIRQLEAQAHERPSQEIQRLEAKIGQLQWVHAEVKQELGNPELRNANDKRRT